ncbi:PaaI family thioesterase [Pyruvatibacter sp.]|uniref:PaaI family thioesterase n=1 Tax=Pyruvatibacter sp. TaxID=1981328 RepID=UPI0032EAB079
MTDDVQKRLDMMRDMLIDHVPHARAIGLEVVAAEKGMCRMKVAYAPHLIGNPDTGVMHGGVITSMLDNACGVAVQMALGEPSSIATLDLRIDYMRPATPRLDVIGEARCYKVTKSVAFVRGTAFHDDPSDPIASCVGAFMLAANRAAPTATVARAQAKKMLDAEEAKTKDEG